jgi:hypothetical protein
VKELMKNTIFNLIVLMICSLILSFLMFNWFGSILTSFLGFIIFWTLVLIYPNGGRKIRRNAVDRVIDKLIEQKQIRPISEMSEWHKGIGELFDTSQPMWIKLGNEGIYLFYLCYSKNPPFLLPWERIFNIKIIKDRSVSYAKLSLNHFNGNFVIPWDDSFDIPKSVKKI